MTPPKLRRREFLISGAGALVACRAARAAESTLQLRITETAGLRRFGYPIHTMLPEIASGTNLRLSQNDKAIPAQFRPVVDAEGTSRIALDFNISLDPLATQNLTVDSGDNAQPRPEPARGLNIEALDSVFRVSGAGISYDVPRDLVGFLNGAGGERRQYLRPDSPGFWLRTDGPDSAGAQQPMGPLRGTLSRKGPIAIGLRFAGICPLKGGGGVNAFVDLTFPSSKSWVEVNWTIDDRELGRIVELGLDLDLAIASALTLVDFGANGTVYCTIKDTERMWMTAGPRTGWQISKTAKPNAILLATSPGKLGDAPAPAAEGWAHVMDATRCTAIAVADFGRKTSDQIDVSANGRIRLARRFASGERSQKSMRAWFHFVGMPVQVGAVTSPQSMLAPPMVEWL
jgi:hypothetical protein